MDSSEEQKKSEQPTQPTNDQPTQEKPSQEQSIEQKTEDKVENIDQEDNKTALIGMGFDPILVSKALQLTNDRERAVELIFQFQDDISSGNKGNPEPTTDQKGTPIADPKTGFAPNYPVTVSPFSFKMVLVVRQDLGMGVGKIAAQVGHAVLGAYKNIVTSKDIKQQDALMKWEEIGQAKIVLKIKGKDEIIKLEEKARTNGLNTCLIQDAGRTQIEPGSYTVLAIGPAHGADIDQITGHLKLY